MGHIGTRRFHTRAPDMIDGYKLVSSKPKTMRWHTTSLHFCFLQLFYYGGFALDADVFGYDVIE